jgi:hypothetical protein
LQDKRRAAERKVDLGTRFNDHRLNERVISDGKLVQVFSCVEREGVFLFECHLCQLAVTGKRNIDSHAEGKKHKVNMANATPAGE